MGETPLGRHQVAVQRLLDEAVAYTQAQRNFGNNLVEYMEVHLALVKTIMESDETYNWLKNQAAAHPEAHTKCIAGLEANREAFQKFMKAIQEYFEAYPGDLEAEALQFLAEAQRNVKDTSKS